MIPNDNKLTPSPAGFEMDANDTSTREKGRRQNEKQSRATKENRAENRAHDIVTETQARTGSISRRTAPRRRGHRDGIQHIDDMLRPLAEREAPPGEEEINTLARVMAEHLLVCEPCQATLSAIIARLTDQAEEGSPERTRGAQLLQRLNAVLVKARVRKLLGPYAAAVYVLGEDAAREEYPEVAAHLEQCEACRQEVAGRRANFEAQMTAALHGANTEPQPRLKGIQQQPGNTAVQPGAVVEEEP